jgi:putative transposase
MTTLLYARRGSGRDTLMRAVVLRLLPDEEAEARLRALCSLSSKLWNEVDYAWRRMFFKEKKVDLKYL